MDFGKAEDRITKLPDSLLHYILSFIDDIKCVARTSILSTRWNYIWTSTPTLVFPSFFPKPSRSEIIKFMRFVDRTLLLHDTLSNICKFHLWTNGHMCPHQVHSWIENVTRRNAQEVDLYLDHDEEPFYIPSALFKCESLIKLKISASSDLCPVHLPKSLSFPRLKTLRLYGIRFTDDDNSWNEQHLSNCPVLEELVIENCSWVGARNFCISSRALKLLEFSSIWEDDGLRDCALEINAPNLVSLDYSACVAREYVLSSFQTLKSAALLLICEDGVPRKQNIAGVNKLIRAVSRVQSLKIHPDTLKALSIVNILPTFHELDKLTLEEGETADRSLFSLLKAMPNLRSLEFEQGCIDNNKEKKHSWASLMSTAGCMFQHLESVAVVRFRWDARQMRWLKLILKNAKALEAVELCLRSDDAINRKVLRSKLISLPRASDKCKFKFDEY